MTVEKKTQLFFRDDNKFQFIKRPLNFGCLVEKSGDVLKRAWRHSYAGQYFFPGYKAISSDMVTPGFGRDIFLDFYNKIPTTDDMSGKPKPIAQNIKEWIAKIGENQRHLYRAKRDSRTMIDYLHWALIGVIVIMVIAWAIRFASG